MKTDGTWIFLSKHQRTQLIKLGEQREQTRMTQLRQKTRCTELSYTKTNSNWINTDAHLKSQSSTKINCRSWKLWTGQFRWFDESHELFRAHTFSKQELIQKFLASIIPKSISSSPTASESIAYCKVVLPSLSIERGSAPLH